MTINYLKNYYEILNITQDATPQEIKDSYKKQALKYHPDKNIGLDTTDSFRDAHEAYEVLKDNDLREDYNNNYQHPSFALFKEFVTRDMSILEVEAYLNKGASINAHNAFNQTILMHAANRFKFDMVEFLSEHNASVNAVDGAGNTPLMYAAIKETVVFSTDNAAIIKERNQKHFERQEEPEENKTTPQQEEVAPEEQIDLTQQPIMETPLPNNILQMLGYALLERVALRIIFRTLDTILEAYSPDSILLINSLLKYLPPKSTSLINFAVVLYRNQELFMKLGPAIYSSIFHSSTGYNIKFTTENKNQEQKEGVISDQEIISSIYDFVFGTNTTNENNHKQKHTEEKQDDHKKQINKAKAKAAEILITNGADYEHVSLYGKTALGYATDFHNIPLMNLLYEIQGMYHKIILEEDNLATDNSSHISSEIAAYDSIIALSNARTEVALKDNVVIDPVLVTKAINHPSKLVKDNGDKLHEVSDYATLAEGKLYTSVIPDLSSTYLTKIPPHLETHLEDDTLLETNINPLSIYDCDSYGTKGAVIIVHNALTATEADIKKALTSTIDTALEAPSQTIVEALTKLNANLDSLIPDTITTAQDKSLLLNLYECDAEGKKGAVIYAYSNDFKLPSKTDTLLGRQACSQWIHSKKDSASLFYESCITSSPNEIYSVCLYYLDIIYDVASSIYYDSINNEPNTPPIIDISTKTTESSHGRNFDFIETNEALEQPVQQHKDIGAIPKDNSELTYPMVTIGDNKRDELAMFNDLSLYACDSNSEKGTVLYNANSPEAVAGHYTCHTWTASADTPYYLAKGNEDCIGPLDQMQAFITCSQYISFINNEILWHMQH